MKKKFWAAASVGALALSGLAVMGAGGAGAAKPVLNGTLHCNSSGTTTFSPGAVLSASQLPKGKDKKIKVTTHTNYTGCTGSEPTSGLPVPTSATVDTKAKNPSRLCQSLTSLPGGKTKYLFGGLYKSKAGAAGTTSSKADNGTPNNLGDDVAVPNDPVGSPGFNVFLAAHGLDGTVSIGTGGTLAGKAYALKSISTVAHSGSILSKVAPCQSAAGLTTVTSTGTVGIGVPA